MLDEWIECPRGFQVLHVLEPYPPLNLVGDKVTQDGEVVGVLLADEVKAWVFPLDMVRHAQPERFPKPLRLVPGTSYSIGYGKDLGERNPRAPDFAAFGTGEHVFPDGTLALWEEATPVASVLELCFLGDLIIAGNGRNLGGGPLGWLTHCNGEDMPERIRELVEGKSSHIVGINGSWIRKIDAEPRFLVPGPPPAEPLEEHVAEPPAESPAESEADAFSEEDEYPDEDLRTLLGRVTSPGGDVAKLEEIKDGNEPNELVL
jgi:hypothetical protein